MAVLTEVRHLFSGQFIGLGTVRTVAKQAVFFNRGMGGDERPTLVGVTAVAELVDGFRFHHGFCH